MTKRSKAISSRGSNTDWETLSTGGFFPMWKPTKPGEDVIFIPLSAKLLPPRGKFKESAMVECELTGGSSESFFMKDVKKGVANGEHFSVPISYNLSGEDNLGIHEKKLARLSKLSLYLLSKRLSMRIIFDGKVKGGQGTVKQFTVQVPRGIREQIASKSK